MKDRLKNALTTLNKNKEELKELDMNPELELLKIKK
jgi:hypothetical protein